MRWPLRRARVDGPSMVPALRHGDVVLVWLRPVRDLPRDGRVVLIELPDRPLSVKRVRRDKTVANQQDLAASVWVEGDNEFASTDSRQLGALPLSSVVGVVLMRLWPHPRLRV